MIPSDSTRMNEWFVPRFGPMKFRAFIGLLFPPYTAICVSFAIIGAILPPLVHWDRVVAIVTIYSLSLGLAAHAADALGSARVKPWANYFSKKELWLMILIPISISYLIGAYYIIFFSPLLLVIALLEGFFLFAYNFEMFGGRFHNAFWLSISWGALPVLAGFAIQNTSGWIIALSVSGLAALIAYQQTLLSRPYKNLKRNAPSTTATGSILALERKLKLLTSLIIIATTIFLFLRIGLT